MSSLFQGSNLFFFIGFILLGIALFVRRVPWNSWGGPFVSVGILGTFYGILVALLGFDVDDVTSSVPRLIDGMKTAFATSVFGVGVSVITRLIHLLRPTTVEVGAPTAQDYIAVMRSQTATLEAIKASIGGNNDSSLLVQVQKMRLDMQDFMKTLSSQSTEAIIKALEAVIKDFNAKINEQFGDNFKQLNAAVGRLVEWMEKHQVLITLSHEQLSRAIEAMDRSVSVIELSGQTLTQVASNNERIHASLVATTRSLAQVPPVLYQIQQSLAGLTGDAQALSNNLTILGKAVEDLTQANKGLEKAMGEWMALSKKVPEASEAIRTMVDSVRTHADAVTAQQRQLIELLRAQINVLARDLTAAHTELMRGLGLSLGKEVQALSTGLRAQQSELLQHLRASLTESGRLNQEAVDRQVKELDKALEEELTKALTTFGGKLASLSQKFVADYNPLTEQLQRVVQLARTIENDRRIGKTND